MIADNATHLMGHTCSYGPGLSDGGSQVFPVGTITEPLELPLTTGNRVIGTATIKQNADGALHLIASITDEPAKHLAVYGGLLASLNVSLRFEPDVRAEQDPSLKRGL